MTTLPDHVLHSPPRYQERTRGKFGLLFDPEAPNWIATDESGAEILRWVDGHRTVSDLVGQYRTHAGKDWAEAWLDVSTFLNHALRTDFLRTEPFDRPNYPGRGELIKEHAPEELWLHVTNRCNLSCAHCLVDSSPKGIEGLSGERWLGIVEEAKQLGVRQFYITGGEPFLRSDLLDIVRAICSDSELVILTNAMFFRPDTLERLKDVSGGRLTLQVSIDGPDAATHNAIRGSGFERTLEGTRALLEAGFRPTVSTVVTRSNIATLGRFPRFLSDLGVGRHHLLWDHKQGRAIDDEEMQSPSTDEIIETLDYYLQSARSCGVELDNYEVARERVQGRRGVKMDLSVAGVSSFCVYADGTVYPSAALVGVPELRMGHVDEQSLGDIWKESSVAKSLRRSSVVDKNDCRQCYLACICGGGDIEHSFFYSGSVLGKDPFSPVHEWLLLGAIEQIASENKAHQGRSGYDSPTVVAAMGDSLSEMQTVEAGGFEIAVSRSTCVLSVDLERSREKVRQFYAEAAVEPQEALCCPTAYDREDLEALPREVVEVSYGCGSPIRFAGVESGETYVDLGSGGGIDCFIAARRVGPNGRVIGIDMTPEMVERAERNRPVVAQSLGYDVVEFRRGYLEQLPLDDGVADIVTSNCVINLSPDKRRVLSEMWRVLKNHGRAIISDTVSESKIPQRMKANPRLWGECVSGALTENEYFATLEQVGFYGLSLVEKSFWKEIEGHRFYSLIIRGFKFGKNGVCNFEGQRAVYLGPQKAVVDEEGHLFPRNEAVGICTDTAAKLSRPPYAGSFLVLNPEGDASLAEVACCEPGQCC